MRALGLRDAPTTAEILALVVFYVHVAFYFLVFAYAVISVAFYDGQAQSIGLFLAGGLWSVIGFPWYYALLQVADVAARGEDFLDLVAFGAATVNVGLHLAVRVVFAHRRAV